MTSDWMQSRNAAPVTVLDPRAAYGGADVAGESGIAIAKFTEWRP